MKKMGGGKEFDKSQIKLGVLNWRANYLIRPIFVVVYKKQISIQISYFISRLIHIED